jgi:branched-subunit amino acid aminotransferase/4-amino-4-deoxychorismate lyase
MTEPLAHLQGRSVPQSQAHIALHDAGFVMGAIVSDVCRTFRHHLFRLPEHLARFRESCRLACVRLRHSDDDLVRIALDLVERNSKLIDDHHDLSLVMCATPGPLDHYRDHNSTAIASEPTLLMHTFPIPFARYSRFFSDGVRLVTPSVRHVPTASIDRRIKHRSRLHWWIAEQEVNQTDPHAVALLLDEHENVTETAAANFLIMDHGTVISPPADSVLTGISLAAVRDFCGRLDIPFREQPLTLEQCCRADEAMLTGTNFCIAGVRSINGHLLPWPGPCFKRLLLRWSQTVDVDIRAQFLSNR